MSVTDIRRAFDRGLAGKAACRTARVDYSDGGRTQHLSFLFVQSGATIELEDSIPHDMCPLQHARHMAMEYLDGRRPATVHTSQPLAAAVVSPVHLPASLPALQLPAPAPAPAPAVAAVPLSAVTAPPSVEPLSDLDAALASGDLASVLNILCQYVDDEAEACRQAWISGQPGQVLEYQQMHREISDLAYAEIVPSPQTCPLLWASVGVDVPSTGDPAADIRAAAAFVNDKIDTTNAFLGDVRTVRLAGKAQIRACTSVEAALQAFQLIVWPTP